MIMINGNWKQVKGLSDVLRIVSENIGDEFAQRVKEVFIDNEGKIEDLEIRISEVYQNWS